MERRSGANGGRPLFLSQGGLSGGSTGGSGNISVPHGDAFRKRENFEVRARRKECSCVWHTWADGKRTCEGKQCDVCVWQLFSEDQGENRLSLEREAELGLIVDHAPLYAGIIHAGPWQVEACNPYLNGKVVPDWWRRTIH